MSLSLRDVRPSPGEGICAVPDPLEEFLSFTTILGQISGVIASLLSQFRKWGYVRYKVDESIWVSPVFKTYYDLVLTQKEQLQASIKAGLASISQAISDFELIWHDLRKYKEFMDYFENLEKGRKLMKEKKEEGVKIFNQANSTLKSIFIDQVDVYTGEAIALKSIAVRWPTIIADFLKLDDKDVEPKDIAKKYHVSEAEGVVLATKNKLYLEWRDNIFFPTVKERYTTLKGLCESRKKSIEEYKNMLKPTIARYKMIVDALESPEARKGILISTAMPYAQAMSGDNVIIWAWKPFAPSEKYKITKESIDKISALDAGFNGLEVEELKKAGMIKNEIDALPLEPSIDNIIRDYMDKVEKHYGVEITIKDVFEARQMLVEQFKQSMKAIGAVEPWVWSPYFVFVNVPLARSVIRTPDGVELEDLEIENMYAGLYTQNFIIVRCLELIAKEKQLENYIGTLLGEYGVDKLKLVKIEEMVKEEFPFIYDYKKEEDSEKKEELKRIKSHKIKRLELLKSVKKVEDAFGKIGFPISFFRSIGPYEFSFQQRIGKSYIGAGEGPAREFSKIRDFLKTMFGVPGFEIKW